MNEVYKEALTLEITNSEFTSNIASFGAGLFLTGIDSLIIKSLFTKN